ncbi:hypothetical protein BCR42DRAFT_456948 [Absidia repens]|uniref:Uncharacterized protein n=1 Tax=Absidia repens TaxID=90262 RepID=A0A1X2HZT9_9FUNG|nr:hypothetical protein BCR42DRAFT_456948 [Absidia repens]
MQTYFTCTMFCLPNSQRQEQLDDEPNAFDLTWRNYLPSTAQLCPCLPTIGRRQQQGILLDDDSNHPIDHNSIAYYNDFYQANAVRGYLDNQHDREFDDLLLTNDNRSRDTGGKSKKRSKRKKYPKRRLLQQRQQQQQQEQQLTPYYDDDYNGYDDGSMYDYQQGPTIYEVYSEAEQQDAVYLGDDQIAKMVNHYDQAGGQQQQQQLCAPRAIPFMINDDGDQHEDEHHYKEPSTSIPPPSSMIPTDDYQEDETEHAAAPTASTAALAAQAMLSEKLEDLTEKLAFIRNNMMDIGSSSSKAAAAKGSGHANDTDDQNGKDDDDTATLHTLKTLGKKNSLERLSISSDMDSIASEALLEYENTSHPPTTTTATTTSDYHNRRFSSNNYLGSDLRMPVGLDSSSLGQSRPQAHPFAYFTEQVDINGDDDDDNDDNNNNNDHRPSSDKSTSGIQGAVLNFGKKWFG